MVFSYFTVQLCCLRCLQVARLPFSRK
uniref:Uncharacterized protein n=1 Tax=Arundo donax TaxID=35708 RepID=A0A0A9AWI9_ARUDO